MTYTNTLCDINVFNRYPFAIFAKGDFEIYPPEKANELRLYGNDPYSTVILQANAPVACDRRIENFTIPDDFNFFVIEEVGECNFTKDRARPDFGTGLPSGYGFFYKARDGFYDEVYHEIFDIFECQDISGAKIVTLVMNSVTKEFRKPTMLEKAYFERGKKLAQK